MNNPQYIFSMYKLSKIYPGGKQVIKDISLSFLPGAKIGVLGGNGAGKSTLLKIMAGVDKEYNGEAKLAEGIKVGYLAQEPELNSNLNIYGNVMEGMSEAKNLVDEFYSNFYSYTNVWGDAANAVHFLPAGTYHIQFYGLNYADSAQDMTDITLYAIALNTVQNNTVRIGPFPPPESANLPNPSEIFNH